MKYKRGYIREDGMVFWNYQKEREYWILPEKFSKFIERAKLENKRSYEINKEKVLQRSKRWVKENPEKAREKTRKSYRKNRIKYLQSHKIWRESDPIKLLRYHIAIRISQSLSRKGWKKQSRTHELLGCSYKEFKEHIELQFVNGMSWENRNLWHLDHIIPCASARSERELIKLQNYRNFQPLWAVDNLKKGSTIIAQ